MLRASISADQRTEGNLSANFLHMKRAICAVDMTLLSADCAEEKAGARRERPGRDHCPS